MYGDKVAEEKNFRFSDDMISALGNLEFSDLVSIPNETVKSSQNRKTIFFLTIPPRAFSSTFSASLRKITLRGNRQQLRLPIRIHRS